MKVFWSKSLGKEPRFSTFFNENKQQQQKSIPGFCIGAHVFIIIKSKYSHINDSFVLYKPKNVVSSDFYCLEPIENGIAFAVADCTGHGVPRAIVSVICSSGLNRYVREFGLKSPAQILDKAKEIVIQEFEKSEDELKDGMDIVLC